MGRDVARVGLGESAADSLERVDIKAEGGGLARGEGETKGQRFPLLSNSQAGRTCDPPMGIE